MRREANSLRRIACKADPAMRYHRDRQEFHGRIAGGGGSRSIQAMFASNVRGGTPTEGTARTARRESPTGMNADTVPITVTNRRNTTTARTSSVGQPPAAANGNGDGGAGGSHS